MTTLSLTALLSATEVFREAVERVLESANTVDAMPERAILSVELPEAESAFEVAVEMRVDCEVLFAVAVDVEDESVRAPDVAMERATLSTGLPEAESAFEAAVD